MMLRTGLEWFKLLVVCLIAILAWQVTVGAEEPVPAPQAELHLLNTMLNADTADPLIEQGYPGSNELFDGDVGSGDCAHYADCAALRGARSDRDWRHQTFTDVKRSINAVPIVPRSNRTHP